MGNNLRERRLLSRQEWPFFLALALLIAAAALLLSARPQGGVAVVEVDGEEVARRELFRLTEPELLPVTGKNGIALTVEFSPSGARVVEADCPDQTCLRTGLLTQAGESAVCLPGRVVLRLEGKAAADAETY